MTESPLEALLDNVNVVSMTEMPSPAKLHAALPLTGSAARTVLEGRRTIREILDRRDPRLFVVVGPCSIHDPAAALDYARRLRELADRVRGTMLLGDARVLREAAHLGRLEGLRQRPAHGRFLPDRRGHSAGARAPAAARGDGPAHRDRGPRPHRPAVPRGPRLLVCDRRAHHREPDPPRDGQRAVGAGRLQERHRRRPRGGGQRDPFGALGAQFPGHERRGPHQRDRAHARQPAGATWCCAAAAGARTTTR